MENKRKNFITAAVLAVCICAAGILGLKIFLGGESIREIRLSELLTEQSESGEHQENTENLSEKGNSLKSEEEKPQNNEKTNTEKGISDEKNRRAALQEDYDKGLFILINKEHPVDKSYKPDDLVDIKYYARDRMPSARYMRKEAAEAFNLLHETALQEAGYEIVMTTAYRSYDFQEALYNNYVAKYGQEQAETFSAQPGKSEHQSGLAVDVSSPSVNYQLTKDYINTKEGAWLNDNAHRFGFIIRFKKGAEDITGYMYEPWHIRYVGITAAKEIYEKDITLEEYIENYLNTYIEKEI